MRKNFIHRRPQAPRYGFNNSKIRLVWDEKVDVILRIADFRKNLVSAGTHCDHCLPEDLSTIKVPLGGAESDTSIRVRRANPLDSKYVAAFVNAPQFFPDNAKRLSSSLEHNRASSIPKNYSWSPILPIHE